MSNKIKSIDYFRGDIFNIRLDEDMVLIRNKMGFDYFKPINYTLLTNVEESSMRVRDLSRLTQLYTDESDYYVLEKDVTLYKYVDVENLVRDPDRLGLWNERNNMTLDDVKLLKSTYPYKSPILQNSLLIDDEGKYYNIIEHQGSHMILLATFQRANNFKFDPDIYDDFMKEVLKYNFIIISSIRYSGTITLKTSSMSYKQKLELDDMINVYDLSIKLSYNKVLYTIYDRKGLNAIYRLINGVE